MAEHKLTDKNESSATALANHDAATNHEAPAAEDNSTASEDILVCTMCDKALESSTLLEQHLETAHNNSSSKVSNSVPEPPPNDQHSQTCNQCSDTFPSLDTLQQHISSNHVRDFIKCSKCMLRFQSRSELNDHVKSNHIPTSSPSASENLPPSSSTAESAASSNSKTL